MGATPLPTSNPILTAALDYARRGAPVFPCSPVNKQPLVAGDKDGNGQTIPNTGGLYKATTDEAQIAAWWQRWPSAMIGVPAGRRSGFWGVDPDAPENEGDKDGRVEWAQICAEHLWTPRTHTHLTPGGGRHLLFKWRDDKPIGNSTGQIKGRGIHVRGEGGYLIFPPSIAANGKAYQIEEALDFWRFEDAPDWLYDLILTKPEPEQSITQQMQALIKFPTQHRPQQPGSNRRYADAALRGEYDAVANAGRGTRNDALNIAALKLGGLVAAGELSENEVTDTLFRAAQASGLVADDGAHSAQKTIKSGMSKGLTQPRTIRPREGSIERMSRRARPANDDESEDGGAQMGPPSNDFITEDSAAIEFVERYADDMRYCHQTGAWFTWNGNIWLQDRVGSAFHLARVMARGLVEDEPERKRVTAAKTSFATGVEKYAQRDPAMRVTIDVWDQDKMLVGTPGGTVDLRSGELRTSLRDDYITKTTKCAPTQSGCPLWLKFLKETTADDADLMRLLQQWAGYCLTGQTNEHAMMFVYGPGGNGKSVFLNIITMILGDYAGVANMQALTASKTDRHMTELASLRGKRLVTASETEEGRAWAESRIKQLTGGDLITARFMRQDEFTYRPDLKLMIAGNHKPILRNVDDAMKRRLFIIPFTQTPKEKDTQLEEKLMGERGGILQWAIDGCMDWQQNGLIRPEVVRKATEEYFSDQDLFAHWLAESCDAEPGNEFKTSTAGDLFTSWSDFAKASGDYPGSARSFKDLMARHGFGHKRTKTARMFVGIRLLVPVSRHD